MALKSLWTLLKGDVTSVTHVTALINKGNSCNATENAGVTGVTNAENVNVVNDSVTPVTPEKRQALQKNINRINDVTPVTAVTAEKIITGANAANCPAIDPPAPPAIDIGTRRPPGLTPALLAASLALDAQIAAAGTRTDDPDRHCYPHSDAMNGSELALMTTHLERFARIGMDVDTAERLADRLMRRDREHDDRHACLECSSLSGGTGSWRCRTFRARGVRDPGLPHDLAGMLARCPTFTDGEPGASGYATARSSDEPGLVHPGLASGPWLTASEKAAADAYHQHHAQCPQCQAAGRGYTSRCSAGAALWNSYQEGASDA